jgi:3-dehydroquinate synthase
MKREPSRTHKDIPDFPVHCHEQRFSVSFDYPVYFSRDIFHPENDLLASVVDRRKELRRHRVKVFIDSGIVSSHKAFSEKVRSYMESRSDRLKMEGPVQIVPGGAKAKNDWNLVHRAMRILAEGHLCRQSYVLVIGGGSVLDMVGLAASLVHRGLRLIRMPSTVLGQNDAGVGVKNGIDDHGMKNFAGTFSPPFAVLNDFTLLRTLPLEHWIGGIAEAFKVAIIKDGEFFRFLRSNAEKLRDRNEEAMETAIRRCAVLHLEHIQANGDPFEFGSARPLDFGHWSAHLLEVLSNHRVGHGQAVAMGIALDACYAALKGFLPPAERDGILDALERTGLPVWSPLMEDKSPAGGLHILKGLDDFREHLGGELNVTLPSPIGRKTEVHEMDPTALGEALLYLKKRAGSRQSAPHERSLS